MEGHSFLGDRISDLPDQLLTKILSLLPAEEVMRTSILSKRWIRVWASVPVLVINSYNTKRQEMSNEELKDHMLKFLTFVKNILYLRESIPLDTIKLDMSQTSKLRSRSISKLIRHVVRFAPRVLFFHIYTRKIFNFESIFTCASIEEMTLKIKIYDLDGYYFEPKSISLPSLKKIELDDMEISEKIMRLLLLECPALEEMNLEHCHIFAHEISSPTLKNLSLTYFFQEATIRISCPSVVFLRIYSNNWGGVILKNMSSLVKAEIIIDKQDYFQTYIDHDLELFVGLSHVTTLSFTMTREVLELLAADIPNCKTLGDLKDLELELFDAIYHWDALACFLQNSPNLKRLTLFCLDREDEEVSEEDLPKYVAFQREYLETVEIRSPKETPKITREVNEMLCALIKTIGKVNFVYL